MASGLFDKAFWPSPNASLAVRTTLACALVAASAGDAKSREVRKPLSTSEIASPATPCLAVYLAVAAPFKERRIASASCIVGVLLNETAPVSSTEKKGF